MSRRNFSRAAQINTFTMRYRNFAVMIIDYNVYCTALLMQHVYTECGGIICLL